ncbi:hypothetical protein [Pseudooceanicola nanhaiensis]|uniref:hypothetical protein n=1 Tax=Pseudooceanicola nanhaiensis TaxID=375761 RepID=UPI001CD49701|nr:hypothetical protein [Pseudooceanicola nanhaiensis]MCA0921055.1 hypothetical protein [Pseudooceanicola nanhaiensis]
MAFLNTRMVGGLFVLPLLLAACEPIPEGVKPEDAEAYKAAVASIGCEMKTERDYLPVELQTGMTREQTIAMGQYLMSRDEAVPLEGGGVKLTTGACA